MSIFNTRLKELKDEKNIMLKDLAAELDISNSKLSYYLNGNSEPPYVLLIAIAKYFDVTTDYLTGMSSYRTINESILAKNISNNTANKNFATKTRSNIIDKNSVLLHDLLVTLSNIEDNDEDYNDIWNMVDIWLKGLDNYITFIQSCCNDQFMLDTGRQSMNNFSKSKYIAGKRISGYLELIMQDTSIDENIKKRIMKKTSYTILPPNSKEENENVNLEENKNSD